MKQGMPNLNDVASEAGVSKSTVSRVLNNKLGNGFSVTEEVRQRVVMVARKLNYRPNLIAKSLTMRSTKMVHILGGSHALSDLGNIYQTIVNQITKKLDSTDEGFDVTVDMSQHNDSDSELPAWRIDGAVILAKCSSATMKDLVQIGIPYVVVNGPCMAGGSSVVPDDIGGTSMALHHLIELGHERIAYASPPPDHLAGHSSLIDRHETYLSVIKRHGLQPIFGHDELLKSPEAFIKSAVRKNGATAILAYGHMGGLNLMQAAHKFGIDVPKELSLLCFCDENANRVMSPGLTFVDLRSRKMGEVAANLLLEQIRSPEKAETTHITLPEKLVLRHSTAPPK